MTIRRHTGGEKEFRYTGKEHYGHTEDTAEFIRALRDWQSQPKWKRKFFKYKEKPRTQLEPKNVKINDNKKKHYKSKHEKHRKNKHGSHKKPHHKKPKTPSFIKSLKLPLFFMLILIIAILYVVLAQEEQILYEEKTKSVVINETLAYEISFSKFLDDVYKSEGLEANLLGYLDRYVKGTSNTGIITEAITDDKDNRIDLFNLDTTEKNLFPRRGKTSQLYFVKGTFKRNYKTLTFQVSSIKEGERSEGEVVEVVKQVKYNETKTIKKSKYPAIRAFVFGLLGKEVKCNDGTLKDTCSESKPKFCTIFGLVEKPKDCGCPTGKRLYGNKCIEIIKCRDGTLAPECSKKLKSQCVDGKLVFNPRKCGCPDNYVARGDTCVKTCSDGTAYGECSDDKPNYCDMGTIVEAPMECGCPRGFAERDNQCIDNSLIHSLDAFEKLNEIRSKHGVSQLRWDNNIYELVKFQASKKLCSISHCSHMDSDGRYFDYYASRFGVSLIGHSGENIAGSDCNRAVADLWLHSTTGHREIMLDSGMRNGALAYDEGNCVLIVTT